MGVVRLDALLRKRDDDRDRSGRGACVASGTGIQDKATHITTPVASLEPQTPRIGPVLSDDDHEPHRIAGELCAAYRMGYIDGPDDPDARFLAKAIHLFRGRVSEY